MNLIRILFSALALFTAAVHAGEVRREWTVDGVKREALIFAPDSAKTAPAPVVFAFHGHGGNMRQAARSFGFHTEWPEAVVIYMQGLPTPSRLVDPEGKRPGWQNAQGEQGDRDVAFFDAVLASVRADFKVDARRIYSTGHSNGGIFTYTLWAARPEVFAAYAPSSAPAARNLAKLKPAPVLHVAGEKDEIVKFSWREPTMDALRKLNETGEGNPWHNVKHAALYTGKGGNDVVTYIHPGTHKFPAEAPAEIVRFFKEHARAGE